MCSSKGGACAIWHNGTLMASPSLSSTNIKYILVLCFRSCIFSRPDMSSNLIDWAISMRNASSRVAPVAIISQHSKWLRHGNGWICGTKHAENTGLRGGIRRSGEWKSEPAATDVDRGRWKYRTWKCKTWSCRTWKSMTMLNAKFVELSVDRELLCRSNEETVA